MGFHPVRSVTAVLGGIVLLGFIDQTLTTTLVAAMGGGGPVDEAAFLAIRNRPLVLVVTIVTHTLAATLTGYILGRIAGTHEVRHAIAASAVVAIIYGSGFFSSNPLLPPMWVRVAMLLVTPPALIGGAYIRGEARLIRAEQGVPAGPEEQS